MKTIDNYCSIYSSATRSTTGTRNFSASYPFGTEIVRTRRTIHPRNNSSTAEIVTYTIQDANGRRYDVDEYSPEAYYELSEYAEVRSMSGIQETNRRYRLFLLCPNTRWHDAGRTLLTLGCDFLITSERFLFVPTLLSDKPTSLSEIKSAHPAILFNPIDYFI